jgi:hypothetical protein
LRSSNGTYLWWLLLVSAIYYLINSHDHIIHVC